MHDGKYDEGDLAARIDAYDRRRAAIHPYKPRDPARWGEVAFYGWSEDKARQYGVPQRADFGAFVRGKGFSWIELTHARVLPLTASGESRTAKRSV